MADRPKEDAGYRPVVLGNPATGSEALFGNTVVKAVAEIHAHVDPLGRKDDKV